MRVTIRRKNLDITPALQRYIELKLLKPIRRSLRNILAEELPILDLELYRRTRHHRKGDVYHAEANLSLDGKILRAHVDQEDMRAAIDLLEEELERQILTMKGRRRTMELRRRRRAKENLRLSRDASLLPRVGH